MGELSLTRFVGQFTNRFFDLISHYYVPFPFCFIIYICFLWRFAG